MKQLSELIPQDLEQNFQLSDILTDEEKETIIRNAVNALADSLEAKLKALKVHPATISEKIKEANFEAQIDKEKLLIEANKRKHWRVEDAREREMKKQQAIEDRRQMVEKYNAGYFYKMIKTYFLNLNGKFIYDSSNEHYIKAICYFFSQDPRFETELGHSFRKGFLIKGTAGLGKTKTIEAIRWNELYPIGIVSMLEISDRVRTFGTVDLNTENFILLDDVGSEQEVVNHYGTKINWFKDFIETYYLHNTVFSKLLITTNCGGDELETKYGYRVRSRIREMFNVIELDGEDKRK